jgi:hypothetical protein
VPLEDLATTRWDAVPEPSGVIVLAARVSLGPQVPLAIVQSSADRLAEAIIWGWVDAAEYEAGAVVQMNSRSALSRIYEIIDREAENPNL